jgi:hypothetical protein
MIHTKNSKKGPKIKDLTPIWDPWYNGGSIIRRKTMANFDALTQNQMEAIYRPHTKAFDNAFEFKVFGKDDPWMYMYSDAKYDYFKHSWTRRYLEVPYSEKSPFKAPSRP